MYCPLINNPSDLLVYFILLILENLTSAGLEVLVLERETRDLPAGELVKVLLNLKLDYHLLQTPDVDGLCLQE